MIPILIINQNKGRKTFLRSVSNLSTSYGNSRPINFLTLDIKQMPENLINFPKTWKQFFDLNLNVISPKNTHLIKIQNETHVEVL
jgi:hypothetical protein